MENPEFGLGRYFSLVDTNVIFFQRFLKIGNFVGAGSLTEDLADVLFCLISLLLLHCLDEVLFGLICPATPLLLGKGADQLTLKGRLCHVVWVLVFVQLRHQLELIAIINYLTLP